MEASLTDIVADLDPIKRELRLRLPRIKPIISRTRFGGGVVRPTYHHEEVGGRTTQKKPVRRQKWPWQIECSQIG